jgi:cytochrome c553
MVRSLAAAAALLVTAVAGRAADAPAIEFFEKHVRPVLVENCVGCHGPQKQKGGLRLDSGAAVMKGGDTGPVIVPGDPGKSRLIDAIGYKNVDLQMPPKGKLPDATIADLTEWIRRGAAWPAEAITKASTAGGFDLAARKAAHWAWKPVRSVPPPAVRDEHWPREPIDRFILARLESAGLAPAPAADKRTLLRRVTFDLTGLPPTAAEIDAFLADDSGDAFARVVDRLLASPRFGERWGRHWLDLVRYAETRGHEFDYPSPNAWQYRDYVIRALNADVPYDQFAREHLAGDLLPQPRHHPVDGFNESVLGTGCWFLGEQLHSPVDPRLDEADRVDNMIDVFSKAFLGLTVACARCHDHKFDAISTKDYYSLLGVFESASYRQVRFDTCDRQRLVAAELRALREKHEPAVRRAVAAAFRPAVARLAESLTDAKGPWAAAIKAAAADPADPLYAWAYATEKPEQFRQRIEKVRQQFSGHVNECDCPKAVVAPPWIPDGAGFESVPAGGIVFGTDRRRPIIGLNERAGMAFDPAWNGLTTAAVCEDDPGDVGKLHRSGRMVRTASFTIVADHLYYLVRGGGQAFACVNSHVMIEGPLHRTLVKSVAGEGGFRWVPHDVGRYRGDRCHVEFSPDRGGDFTVAAVMLADQPPAAMNPHWPVLAAAIADASTPAELAAALQRAFLQALDGLADGRAEPGLTRLADWIVRHGDLFDVDIRSEAVDAFPAAQAKLVAQVPAEARLAPAMLDGSGVDERVFVRGNPKTLGEPAPRRFLEALVGPAPLNPTRGSGRLELARQVTDSARDPFLARVMVNRVWHHLFGRGIVASTDNFGGLGEPPTHPELLDNLAAQFVRDGWSLKRLIRSAVLSSTYQMESRSQPAGETDDPQNLLARRQNPRRLEGEAIRDAILAVSGRLDEKMFGPPVPVHITEFQEGRGKPAVDGPLDGRGRRSIYLAVRRNFLSPFLLAFDTPAPATCVGRRTVSDVPTQALILLNDPFVHEQAEEWGRRVAKEPEAGWMDRMFIAALGRPPTISDRRDCLAFLGRRDDAAARAELAHVLFNVNDFIVLH